MIRNNDVQEGSSKAGRLEMFFDRSLELDVNKITVEDFLHYFDSRNVKEHFDLQKIAVYLARKAKMFETEILGKCPNAHCRSSNVKTILDRNGHFKGCYRCLECKKRFKAKGFVTSRFSYGTCAFVLASFAQGRTPRETHQLLVTERTNDSLAYGVREEIPDEKTFYDIVRKSARKLEKFNELMVLLLGGIPCRILFCDDAFARKRRQSHPPVENKKKQKSKRFYYAILALDGDSRFIICLYVASSRDKNAFRSAFGKTEERLRTLPEMIKGDKLVPMEGAARIFFPTDRVKHIFKKLKVTEKGDLMIIERRIKDIRKTIRKRQKCGSFKTLVDLAILAVIELNYLSPMAEALGGKSPAQAVGIPYPFSAYDWREFMIWVDWVYSNISEILKSGLKDLPGCSLKPSTDSSDQTFKERQKLRKRKRH